MIVTFDIANQQFDFYSDADWANQIAEWRDELELDMDNAQELDQYEVVEYMYGDEMWFEAVPNKF
jgi:hypothetical protein|tara:strand:+ start:421 stop:615 length:195 start_codon:yes stop_codon:yes gene_type:complete